MRFPEMRVLGSFGGLAGLVLGLALASSPVAADGLSAVLYKSPTCGCCAGYAAYLRTKGFTVSERDVESLDAVKTMFGVPQRLQACHTMVIDGYVVEGHVPVGDVYKLLAKKPDIRGLSLPGMPSGVPGMPGPRAERVTLYTFGKRSSR